MTETEMVGCLSVTCPDALAREVDARLERLSPALTITWHAADGETRLDVDVPYPVEYFRYELADLYESFGSQVTWQWTPPQGVVVRMGTLRVWVPVIDEQAVKEVQDLLHELYPVCYQYVFVGQGGVSVMVDVLDSELFPILHHVFPSWGWHPWAANYSEVTA